LTSEGSGDPGNSVLIATGGAAVEVGWGIYLCQDGAGLAAEQSKPGPSLVLVVSCLGARGARADLAWHPSFTVKDQASDR